MDLKTCVGRSGESLGGQQDDPETCWWGSFLVAVKHPLYSTLQIRRWQPQGAAVPHGAPVLLAGMGRALERQEWDASGEGPHGNVLCIINNTCLCLWSVTACCCAIRGKGAAGCIYTARLCGSQSTWMTQRKHF